MTPQGGSSFGTPVPNGAGRRLPNFNNEAERDEKVGVGEVSHSPFEEETRRPPGRVGKFLAAPKRKRQKQRHSRREGKEPTGKRERELKGSGGATEPKWPMEATT